MDLNLEGVDSYQKSADENYLLYYSQGFQRVIYEKESYTLKVFL